MSAIGAILGIRSSPSSPRADEPVSAAKPRVRLLAMGGTIAVKESAEGALHALNADELVALIPGSSVELESVDVAVGSSVAFTGAQLLRLARSVVESADDGADGVLITHGTDTLEETLYFLALTVPRGRLGVVVTGAMRPADTPGADGPANLVAGLAVAVHEPARVVGPLLVLDGLMHSARFATKVSAQSVGGFASPAAGPLGRVLEGHPSIWFTPAYEDYLGLPDGDDLPRVELMRMTLGSGPEALSAVVATGPAGVVIDGFGGGHVPPALTEIIENSVSSGIPVVVTSRVGDGPTNSSTYGAPGCELDLQRRGVIMAGAISGVKARLRLAVALALGLNARDAFPLDDGTG